MSLVTFGFGADVIVGCRPEEMSRDELIELVRQRDARIAAQQEQIAAMAAQMAELVEV